MSTPTFAEPIGPLQLRVMHHLWQVQSATVHEVTEAVNAQGGTALAYTTYLTVLRNLVRRKLLAQKKTATKRHQFSVVVDEHTYKSLVLKALYRDYCGSDLATLKRYLGE